MSQQEGPKPEIPPSQIATDGAAGFCDGHGLPVQVVVQEIRDWLSLNLTELSRAIGVERATVYAWIKGTATMPHELAKRERLQFLFDVAQRWKGAAEEPLGVWRQFPILDGRSILDLVGASDSSSPNVSEAELVDAIARLAHESRRAAVARAEGVRRLSETSRKGSSPAPD